MWANVFLILLIGGLTYAGSKRGVVQELGDWAAVLGGATIAGRLFRPIGSAMHASIWSGWPEDVTYKTAFGLLFVPAALLFFSAGLHFDRVTREEERIPENIRTYTGTFVAFIKAMTLAGLFCAWMPNSEFMAPQEKHEFHQAFMVNTVRAANPLVSAIVWVAAPSDLAKEFSKMMQRRS